MDTEIKEKMKSLLEKMLKKIENVEEIEDMVEQAIKDPCKISINKDCNGGASLSIEGRRLTLLFTLAGLEQTLLRQLKCKQEEFELIKEQIGTREVVDSE